MTTLSTDDRPDTRFDKELDSLEERLKRLGASLPHDHRQEPVIDPDHAINYLGAGRDGTFYQFQVLHYHRL